MEHLIFLGEKDFDIILRSDLVRLSVLNITLHPLFDQILIQEPTYELTDELPIRKNLGWCMLQMLVDLVKHSVSSCQTCLWVLKAGTVWNQSFRVFSLIM